MNGGTKTKSQILRIAAFGLAATEKGGDEDEEEEMVGAPLKKKKKTESPSWRRRLEVIPFKWRGGPLRSRSGESLRELRKHCLRTAAEQDGRTASSSPTVSPRAGRKEHQIPTKTLGGGKEREWEWAGTGG